MRKQCTKDLKDEGRKDKGSRNGRRERIPAQNWKPQGRCSSTHLQNHCNHPHTCSPCSVLTPQICSYLGNFSSKTHLPQCFQSAPQRWPLTARVVERLCTSVSWVFAVYKSQNVRAIFLVLQCYSLLLAHSFPRQVLKKYLVIESAC